MKKENENQPHLRSLLRAIRARGHSARLGKDDLRDRAIVFDDGTKVLVRINTRRDGKTSLVVGDWCDAYKKRFAERKTGYDFDAIAVYVLQAAVAQRTIDDARDEIKAIKEISGDPGPFGLSVDRRGKILLDLDPVEATKEQVTWVLDAALQCGLRTRSVTEKDEE